MTANEAIALWATAKVFARYYGGSPVTHFRSMIKCPDRDCDVCFPANQGSLFA